MRRVKNYIRIIIKGVQLWPLYSFIYFHTVCIFIPIYTLYILKKRSSEDNRLLWWTMTGSNCRHPACKAGALPAELIVHVVTRPGIEPGIPPWKGGVLTAWPTGQNGSSSRTRTYDRSVNSRLLYRLSYRGMVRLLLYVRLIIKASFFFKNTIN